MDSSFKFSKERFADFFSVMKTVGKVYAPVKVSELSYSFKNVEKDSEIAFEALRTILPPKKFFFPQEETIVVCDGDQMSEVVEVPAPFVVFGVHPCDLAGLVALDKIFLSAPLDSHYQRRRRAAIIVGLSCLPDKHCFCRSMGTDTPNKGYDLFLTDLGEEFYVQLKSQAGLELLQACSTFVQPVNNDDNDSYKDFWSERDKLFERTFDSAQLPNLMDMGCNDPIWDQLAERCLSCGNCTPVCPTCYCFDMVDVAMLNTEKMQAKRDRVWDSCQFSGFAAVAGGENFRPGPIDRLKFWYRHKLHGFDDAIEIPSCVGCGRCTVSCPAGIDDLPGVVMTLLQKSSMKDAV